MDMPSFWTAPADAAPWWVAPLVTIIVTGLNVWGARLMSNREHRKTAEKVDEVHRAVTNGNGKADMQ